MPDPIQPYLEALKLLKEWSSTLLVLQTGILAAIGGFIDKDKIKKGNRLIITSMFFFSASILMALHVIGTIPWSAQKLPELVAKYKDIYQFPNFLGIPIWFLAFGQHIFFILAVAFFLAFVIVSLKKNKSS